MPRGYGYGTRADPARVLAPADSRIELPSTMDARETARLPAAGAVGDAHSGVIRSEDFEILIDLDNKLITITDAQDPAVERVLIGKLGSGPEDYGIEIYDELGVLKFSATGELQVATLSEITDDAGIIVAGKLQGANITLDLDAAGTDPVLEGPNLELLANGALALGSQVSIDAAGNATFSGTLSAASGTFGTVTAGLLDGANVTLDLDAAGTDPVLDMPGWQILADGTIQGASDIYFEGVVGGVGTDKKGAVGATHGVGGSGGLQGAALLRQDGDPLLDAHTEGVDIYFASEMGGEEDARLQDAGTTGATEDAWLKIRVGASVFYARLHATP